MSSNYINKLCSTSPTQYAISTSKQHHICRSDDQLNAIYLCTIVPVIGKYCNPVQANN